MPEVKFKGFICYAQKNIKIHDFFKERLKVKIASENAEIELFSDVDIRGGEKWDDRIKNTLEKSDFFIILVSNDLYASEYVKDKEFPLILKHHHLEGKVIMPIKVSETGYGKNTFAFLSEVQFFRPDFFDPEETYGDKLGVSEDTNWQDRYMNQLYAHLISVLSESKSQSANKGKKERNNLFTKILHFPHIADAIAKKDTRRKFRYCKPDEKMIYAANEMKQTPPVRHLAVVQDDNMLLKGIISRRDIAKQEISRHFDKKGITSQLSKDTIHMLVEEVMTHHDPPYKEVFFLDVDDLIKEAVKLFATRPNGHAIGGLPIVNQDGVIEMLSYSDILEFLDNILSKEQIEELNKISANDIGTKTGVVSLLPEDDLGTAYFVITGQPPRRALPIADASYNLKGMISDVMVLENYNLLNRSKPVKEFMRVKDFGLKHYFNPSTKFDEIIKVLRAEKDLTSLPVIKDEKLLGVISYADVLKKILKVLDPEIEEYKTF